LWLVLTDANLFAISTGVEDGMTVRVPGEGDAPMSTRGSNGDLLVRVNVNSSNVWRRQGTNLYYDAAIPLHTAVLGGRIRVPTLDGEVEVRVAPGTQPGEDAVLRGRGVQSVMQKGAKGDLFISYLVQIPRFVFKLAFALSQTFLVTTLSLFQLCRKRRARNHAPVSILKIIRFYFFCRVLRFFVPSFTPQGRPDAMRRLTFLTALFRFNFCLVVHACPPCSFSPRGRCATDDFFSLDFQFLFYWFLTPFYFLFLAEI
jgi:hypothetical protein